MANSRNHAQRLRNAVEALPSHTQAAMLEAINTNCIIVGAYVDKRGGVCPMLGAHRCGGRTNFSTFARAWDAYTDAKKGKSRRASAREVNTLRSYLTMAVGTGVPDMGTTPTGSLAGEVRVVQAARRRRAEEDARTGEGVTIEQLLNETYAEASERRSERRAAEILDTDDARGGQVADDSIEPSEPFRGIAAQLESTLSSAD